MGCAAYSSLFWRRIVEPQWEWHTEAYEWKWTFLIQAHSPKYGGSEGISTWSHESIFVIGMLGSTSSLSHGVTLLPADGSCAARFQLAYWKYECWDNPRIGTTREYWRIVQTQNWFVVCDIHNSSKITCSDDLEVKIPFRIQIGRPSAYNVTTHFVWKVTMNADAHDRTVSINYTFFANGNYLFWIREDFVGALKGTFGGAYPPQTISNSSTMNTGNNELKIKVNINSISGEPSACYFKLEMYKPHVNVTALDSMEMAY